MIITITTAAVCPQRDPTQIRTQTYRFEGVRKPLPGADNRDVAARTLLSGSLMGQI